MGGVNPAMIRKMQERLLKAQEEISKKTVEATTGGGAVTVVVTGSQKVESIKIDPEAVDKDDITLLEDMLVAAVNDGIQKSQDMAQQHMSQVAGLPKIPGLM